MERTKNSLNDSQFVVFNFRDVENGKKGAHNKSQNIWNSQQPVRQPVSERVSCHSNVRKGAKRPTNKEKEN